MQRYKMARWRLILRRDTFHRSLIRNIRRLRHSHWRAARFCSTLLLSIAWLVLPMIPGCSNRTPTASFPSDPSDAMRARMAAKSPPPASPAPPVSGRSVKVQALDSQYRGTTRVASDKQLIHQKD